MDVAASGDLHIGGQEILLSRTLKMLGQGGSIDVHDLHVECSRFHCGICRGISAVRF